MPDGPLFPSAGFQTGNLKHNHFYLTDKKLCGPKIEM